MVNIWDKIKKALETAMREERFNINGGEIMISFNDINSLQDVSAIGKICGDTIRPIENITDEFQKIIWELMGIVRGNNE